MTLEERINEDIKSAMKAKDRTTLEAIRSIRAAIINAKTEVGSGGIFREEDSLKLLQKLKKQREDAAAIYREQSRPELYEHEEAEAKIISRYLPEMMSEEAVDEVVAAVVTELGASGMGDMGRVMGAVTAKLAGKAEGKVIATIVRKRLA